MLDGSGVRDFLNARFKSSFALTLLGYVAMRTLKIIFSVLVNLILSQRNVVDGSSHDASIPASLYLPGGVRVRDEQYSLISS